MSKISPNRRGYGSYWRGHKERATLTIPAGTTIRRVTDHSEEKTYYELEVRAERAVHGDGNPLDSGWYFIHCNYGFYVEDSPALNARDFKMTKPRRY